MMNCANTEGIFRIIQSIPSPKAEPFKRWLAKVGYERIQEIENPELATKRTRMLYKLKGYNEDWIEKRMRGIVIREELTEEWKNRGHAERRDYEILTAEISKATFGVTPSQYKKLKGLKRENLRDHMDDFELIFNMLGERATTEIHKEENSRGIPKLKSRRKSRRRHCRRRAQTTRETPSAVPLLQRKFSEEEEITLKAFLCLKKQGAPADKSAGAAQRGMLRAWNPSRTCRLMA